MEEFLRQYGLIAVYFGMALEGETVLVMAGFLASQGLLPRGEVLLCAVLGALTVDHLVFYAGRHATRFAWMKRALGVDQGPTTWRARLGESWPVFLMIRFIYGARSPYIFWLGTRGMKWPRFAARDVGPVLAWCFVWLFFGHAIGNLVLLLYGKIHHHQAFWIMVGMGVAALAIFAALAIRRHRRLKRPLPPEAPVAD